MDEAEMLAEIDSSRKWFLVAGILVGVAVLAIVLYFTMFRGTPSAETPPPPKPAAVAAAPPPPPAPAPPAPAPPPPPPKAPTITPSQLINQAGDEAKQESWPAAVEDYLKAAELGGDPKELKKLDAALQKGLTAKAVRAKKRKDKPSEADARALLAKLKSAKKK
jgi:type IV secretory pathway VirB10-like protein